MKRMLAMAIVYFPFTPGFRSFLYRVLLGYNIGRRVKCKYGAVINADEVIIGNDSVIGRFAKINSLSEFEIGEDSLIDNYVKVFGPAGFLWGQTKPKIKMGNQVAIMANWLVDVCGSITAGNNVLFAGQYGQIWTHTFDLNNNRMDFEIVIGSNIYVGSGCILCGNVYLCDDIVISAGSTITGRIEEPGVYATGLDLERVGKVHDFSDLYSNGIEVKQKVTRAKQYTIYSKISEVEDKT